MTPEAWRLGDMFSQAARKLSVPEIRAHTTSCFTDDEDSHPAKKAWGSGVRVTADVRIPNSGGLCAHPPHGRAGASTTPEVPGGPSPCGSRVQGICSSMGLGKASYTPKFGGRRGGLESHA